MNTQYSTKFYKMGKKVVNTMKKEKRAGLAVDYVASPLWITLRCGLRGFATVDFARWCVLWISGLEEEVGARFAPTPPQAGLSPARFASYGCSSGAPGEGVCGRMRVVGATRC